MDELTIGDKIYISSKKAASITGYAKDYVGQLCREGRVEARLVGRNWYVLESSVREHRFGKETTASTLLEPVEEPKMPVTATWQAPTYSAEPMPTHLPKLVPTPRPAGTGSIPEVSDMQAAWREWFETREQTAVPAPDADDRPLESDYTGDKTEPEPEIVELAHQDDEQSDISSSEAIFGGPVVTPEEALEEPWDSTIRTEQDDLEPVVVNRSPVGTRPRDVIDLTRLPDLTEPTYHQPRSEKMPRPKKGRSHVIVQAIFVAVAGLSLVTALIGSGLVDSALGVNKDVPVPEGPIIDLIQGERSVKN